MINKCQAFFEHLKLHMYNNFTQIDNNKFKINFFMHLLTKYMYLSNVLKQAYTTFVELHFILTNSHTAGKYSSQSTWYSSQSTRYSSQSRNYTYLKFYTPQAHHTSHFFCGFIGFPTGHLKASAKYFEFGIDPMTLEHFNGTHEFVPFIPR